MPAIVRKPLSSTIAETFVNSFTLSPTTGDSIYIALGKVAAWQPDDQNPLADDSNPVLPLDYDTEAIELKRNIFGIKKINQSNVSVGVRTINWVTGTVYDFYNSNDSSLYLKDFYVVTPNNNIYKCLYNNNGGLSTQNPDDAPVLPGGCVKTNDGYIWKLMYKIPAQDFFKFATATLVPIDNTLIPDTIRGQINHIEVINGGVGYTSPPTVIIQGDGIGAVVTATLLGGAIDKIIISNVDDMGSGYTWANVTVTGGSGSGAILRASISPYKGHGSNNIDELFSRYCIISTETSYEEDGDFLVNNDFRQVSLIKNPLLGNGDRFVDSTGNCQYVLTVDNITGISTDIEVEIINNAALVVGHGNIARAYLDGLVYKISLTNVRMLQGNVLDNTKQLRNLSTLYDISQVQPPELDIFSGVVIYSSNRTPVSRDISQKEIIKIPLVFS